MIVETFRRTCTVGEIVYCHHNIHISCQESASFEIDYFPQMGAQVAPQFWKQAGVEQDEKQLLLQELQLLLLLFPMTITWNIHFLILSFLL